MKTFLCVLMSLILSEVSLAKSLDTPARAEAVQKRIMSSELVMKYLNGIGISGCDPRTGEQSYFQGDFVHCVSISTWSDSAAKMLYSWFPAGRKVDGVFVVIKVTGEIRPYPGVKVSN